MSPKSLDNTAAALIPADIVAIVGARNLSNYYESRRKNFAVTNIIIHEDWNPNSISFDADIAILTIEEKIRKNKHIAPVCVWKTANSTINEGIVVSLGQNKDRTSDSVSQTSLQILQNKKCFLPASESSKVSSKRTFCAAHAVTNNICVGDNGNGMFVLHENVLYLRGVSSLSLTNPEFCLIENYGIYTDILAFTDWIEEKVATPKYEEMLNVDETERNFVSVTASTEDTEQIDRTLKTTLEATKPKLPRKRKI